MSDAATDRKAKARAADLDYKAVQEKTKAAETRTRLAKLKLKRAKKELKKARKAERKAKRLANAARKSVKASARKTVSATRASGVRKTASKAGTKRAPLRRHTDRPAPPPLVDPELIPSDSTGRL